MSFESFFIKVKDAGYDGVEMSLPMEPGRKEEILGFMKKFDLQLIAQHWETLTADYESHQEEYRQKLVNLATGNPLFINTQTGKDFFTYEQNADLLQIADEVSREYGVKIIHETHRGKFSFAAHIAAGYLKEISNLRITLDISHWCNVAESWLDDQQDAVNLAISRTDHIHARIGFPEGPQIPDPRVPEWKEALDKYTGWWKQVIDLRRKDGWKEFTVTPEFGPFPYMTILPFTKQPITNQWEVNKFMMDYLRKKLNNE
jgi:sugar phosphate isomerase/epimerase